MANKIETKKLIQDLEEAVKQSKDLLKLTDKTNEIYVEMAKTVKESFDFIDKKTTKGIIEFNKAIENSNTLLEKQEENKKKIKKANDDLTKQQKQLITLRKKLNDGLSDESKELEELKQKIQEQNRIRKKQVRDAMGLNDAYKRESDRLRKLKKDYKNLAVEGKENTKVARELKKEIEKLDDKLVEIDETVNDNSRSIGKYSKAMEGLNKTAKRVGLALAIDKIVELLGNAFGDTREGALLLEQAMAKATAGAKVMFTALFTWSKGAADVVSGNFNKMKIEIGNSVKEIKKILTLGFGQDEESKSPSFINTEAQIKELDGFIVKVKERIEQVEYIMSREAVPSRGSQAGFESQIKNLKDQLDAYIKERARLRKELGLPVMSTEELEEQIARGNKAMGSVKWSTLWDDAMKAGDAFSSLAELAVKYEITNKNLETQIAKTNAVFQTQLQIGENDKLSFETRIAASEKAVESAKQLRDLEIQYNRNILDSAKKKAVEKLKAAGLEIDADKVTSESLIDMLKEQSKAMKISEADHQDFVNAYVQLKQAEMEADLNVADATEKNLNLYSDLNELRLDIELDALDNQKTINEKRILSDKETFDKRKQLLEDTIKLFEDGAEEQIKIVVNQGIRINNEEKRLLKEKRKRIAGDINLTQEQKDAELERIDAEIKDFDRQNKKITQTDLLRILRIDDVKLQKEELKNLGLGEKFTLRYLEVIKDYKTGKKDLLDTQTDLNDALAEELDIQKKIAAQQKVLSGEMSVEEFEKTQIDRDIDAAIKKLVNTQVNSKERSDAQLALNNLLIKKKKKQKADADKDEIDAQEKHYSQFYINLQRRLINEVITEKEFRDQLLNKEIELQTAKVSAQEIGSAEYLNEQKKLNDLILEQQENSKNDQEDKTQEILEARQRVLQAATDVFEEILDRAREKREAALDREIDALDDRASQIRDAINAGNDDARSSLAEIERKQAENEAKKEKLRKREIRDRQVIAGLAVLAANAGEENAVAKTLSDISLVTSTLNSLPEYFEGTEDTGTVGSKALDSNGGRLTMLHDNERVMTAKQNARIGSMSNEDLADLAQMHNSGSLESKAVVLGQSNKELVSKMEEMTKAVKNIPVQAYNYDANAKYHEQVLKSANKREVIKQKANNLFK